MRFWQAIRAMEEGDVCKSSDEDFLYKIENDRLYFRGEDSDWDLNQNSFFSLHTQNWEIIENPEFYYEWRSLK